MILNFGYYFCFNASISNIVYTSLLSAHLLTHHCCLLYNSTVYKLPSQYENHLKSSFSLFGLSRFSSVCSKFMEKTRDKMSFVFTGSKLQKESNNITRMYPRPFKILSEYKLPPMIAIIVLAMQTKERQSQQMVYYLFYSTNMAYKNQTWKFKQNLISNIFSLFLIILYKLFFLQ